VLLAVNPGNPGPGGDIPVLQLADDGTIILYGGLPANCGLELDDNGRVKTRLG
jgi:hypothetical protein